MARNLNKHFSSLTFAIGELLTLSLNLGSFLYFCLQTIFENLISLTITTQKLTLDEEMHRITVVRLSQRECERSNEIKYDTINSHKFYAITFDDGRTTFLSSSFLQQNENLLTSGYININPNYDNSAELVRQTRHRVLCHVKQVTPGALKKLKQKEVIDSQSRNFESLPIRRIFTLFAFMPHP
ncbi:CLUMA_CG000267, isoform A [Clunio marinus]|uniref:CLUMA_CG000267, isoform A n=1 Tax=Clunio marinus TaxID=568069 RepID=A0A1J1HJ51_9DIPT|nr:CLUMA_CG000267, isoform A [Clunio marinus]